MKRLCILLVLLCGAPAWADRTTDQVQLAATGRFDTLEKVLEEQAAQGPLDTRDRHALCYAYSKTKRYTKLMDCLDKLATSLKSGSKRTRLFQLDDATPSLGIMRAEALLELGQYQAAIRTAQANLDWLRADKSDDLDMVFNTMSVLSMAHTLSGDKEAGYQVSEQLAKFSAGFMGPYVGAKALALARARMAQEDYEGVIDAVNSDKLFAVNVFLDKLATGSFFTGVNNWVWVELPRAFMINKALAETGRIDEARKGFDRLLDIRQVKENGEIYWLLLNERARLAEKDNDKAGALEMYRRAIDVVEEQRASINTESSKIGFVGDKQALYARAISMALALNQSEVAYEYMERAKSRALVDLLAAKNAQITLKGVSAESVALLDSYDEASANASTQLPLDMASAGSADARGAVRVKAAQLKKRDPALASLVSVGALSMQEVRAYLQPNEVLIEYYMNGKNVVLMAVSADKVHNAVLDAANLDKDIRNFRSQIEKQDPKSHELAAALFKRLLGPVQDMIEGRDLVVVPHGILHYLPFAALHDGKSWLLDAHNLRFLPSASVHQYMRKPHGPAIDSMLIFGNPDLGRADLDLPSAEEEAKAIAGMVQNSVVVTRLQASETMFKAEAGRYAYLHVAAHGQFKSDAPLQSRLALAADKQNDGSLTLGEIYGLRLNAELVTLSACETGLTKAVNGDDLIGMTRGFLYAGSSNIIASLWEVDDVATGELMTAFYRNVKAGMSKKEALRAAQKSLWPKFAEPVFWAAFYLTGQGT